MESFSLLYVAIAYYNINMKPYKILKTKGTPLKKARVLAPLKKIKMPYVFFKNSFTPPKGEINLKD
jgi:hypothetical protein